MRRCLLAIAAIAWLGCPAQGKPPAPDGSTATVTEDATETSAAVPDDEPNAPVTPPAPPPTPTAAASNEPVGETLYVDAALVDCEGEGPMKCMRVRRTPDGEWELFYDAIRGFEHEAGHRYELRVRTQTAADAPADGSTRVVELIEVVSKEKVAQ